MPNQHTWHSDFKHPDWVGSLAAIKRSALRAQETGTANKTTVVISVNGKPVHISAKDLIEMREPQAAKAKP